MPVFAYSGTDHAAASVRGTITADTPRSARDQLRARGIRIGKIDAVTDSATANARSQTGGEIGSGSKPAWNTSAWNTAAWRARPGSAADWATALEELSMMLGAGLPILDSLDTLADQASGRFEKTLLQIRESIASGRSLAEAMSRHQEAFDAASVHMVAVGENSGSLEQVLAHLAAYHRKRLAFRDTLATALMYPLFLVFFGIAAAIFLMTWVLPPLLETLEETVTTLPWPTRVVRTLSEVLLAYWGPLFAVTAIAMVGLAIGMRTHRGRWLWHSLLLRLPIVATMVRKQSVSRIATVVSTLIQSGVELTRAFELASDSIPNEVFRDSLKIVTQRISAGEELADAFRGQDAFPPLAARVFAIGQESGQLDVMLKRLSADYDRQVTSLSTRLTSLIEPVLILVLAVMVGFLLLATVLPILEAGNVLA